MALGAAGATEGVETPNVPSTSGRGSEAAVTSGMAEQEAEPRGELRVLKLMLSGACAGAVSRTATAPIDRIKMILQVAEGQRALTVREGFLMIQAEGSLHSYFKGNGANVIKIAPETALKLTLNDRLKRAVVSDPEAITPLERMASGGLSGAIAQFTIYPLELIRTRLAVSPSGTYHGIGHCFRTVLASEGGRAFYRGLVPSMVGIIPYAGVDIAVFEIFKEMLLDRYSGSPPPAMILGAGMASSSIAQFASYPLALVRTRLQAQGAGGEPLRYKGMMDVIQQTIAREGVRGLFKGLLPNLVKLAPAAGISWFIFEEVKSLLGVDPRS